MLFWHAATTCAVFSLMAALHLQQNILQLHQYLFGEAFKAVEDLGHSALCL